MTRTVPMQPLVKGRDKITRFKANPLVRFLLTQAEEGKVCNMNTLMAVPATNDERAQFAQLIGYSLSGWGDLSYVSGRLWLLATAKAKP